MSTVTMEALAPVISRAASDPAFRQQLVSSPAATLESAGVSIPSGTTVKVVEATQNVRYAVISARPAGLSDSDLAQLVAESLPAPSSVEEKIASYAQLLAKSWTDSALRSQLLSNPAGTLAAHGISVPAGVTLHAVEATETSLVVAVPPAAATTPDTTSGTTLGDMAASITSSFTNLTKLITAGSYLAGLAFSAGAVMKFKQHKDNPTQVPIGTSIAVLFVGASLLFLPSILDASSSSTT